ncbi:hypothetical protein AHAS_Ahas17G0148400 [Arachis hypogaea]
MMKQPCCILLWMMQGPSSLITVPSCGTRLSLMSLIAWPHRVPSWWGTEDIQGPSKVTTKGRPKSKRLGSELEKSIKKSMRRKRKKSGLDNRVESSGT